MSQAGVEVRAYRPGDDEALARNLRDQDRAELDACGHADHLAAIRSSVERSRFVCVIESAGEMVCILGLSEAGTALASYGVPWLLGTPLVPLRRRALARLAPRYIRAMLGLYPELRNLVHADNTVAVRWLRRAGFTLHPAQPHPATGAPFHLFEMSNV